MDENIWGIFIDLNVGLLGPGIDLLLYARSSLIPAFFHPLFFQRALLP